MCLSIPSPRENTLSIERKNQYRFMFCVVMHFTSLQWLSLRVTGDWDQKQRDGRLSSVLLRIWKIDLVHEDLQILPTFFQGDPNTALIFAVALFFNYIADFLFVCFKMYFLFLRKGEIKAAVFVKVQGLKCWIFNSLVNFPLRVQNSSMVMFCIHISLR